MRLVIDTSVFVNPESQRFFGTDAEQAVKGFLDICRKSSLELFMPVSIFRELSNFVQSEVLIRFRRQSVVRAPDLYNIQVPAVILHSFIGDLRKRVNQGLRVAEKAMERSNIPADNLRWLREHYRTALRTGIIDSVEDLEVVLLAKEVTASVLSVDQGINSMAESLGIEVFSASEFADRFADDAGRETNA